MSLRAFVSLHSAAAALAALAAPARAEEPPSYYVLAVGVNEYKTLPPLRGAASDARRLAAFYEAQGARAVTLLTDADATGAKVRAALDGLTGPGGPRKGETVVVALSGHGLRAGGRWLFAPSDYDAGRRPDPGRPGNLNPTAVDDWAILSSVGSLLAAGHRVVLVLDCCFAGEVRHSDAWATYVRATEEDPAAAGGLVLLAASMPGQTSKDGPENGRFTEALLEALGGKADLDRDRRVTVREVAHYLSWRLRELEYKRPKLPGLLWAEQDHLAFATPGVPESFVLARGGDARPLKQGADLQLRPGGLPLVGKADPSPVGVWGLKERVAGPGGKVYETAYMLALTADGRYEAAVRAPDGSTTTAAGKYLHAPGFTFRLEYGNGTDSATVDAVTDDELKVTVYPEPVRRATTYTLRRVKPRE